MAFLEIGMLKGGFVYFLVRWLGVRKLHAEEKGKKKGKKKAKRHASLHLRPNCMSALRG